MTGDSGIDSKGHRGILTVCSGGQPGTGWPPLTQAALRLGAAAVTVPVFAHRFTYSCAAGGISTEVARTFIAHQRLAGVSAAVFSSCCPGVASLEKLDTHNSEWFRSLLELSFCSHENNIFSEV